MIAAVLEANSIGSCVALHDCTFDTSLLPVSMFSKENLSHIHDVRLAFFIDSFEPVMTSLRALCYSPPVLVIAKESINGRTRQKHNKERRLSLLQLTHF